MSGEEILLTKKFQKNIKIIEFVMIMMIHYFVNEFIVMLEHFLLNCPIPIGQQLNVQLITVSILMLKNWKRVVKK